MRLVRICVALVGLGLARPAEAHAQRYQVDLDRENRVRFVSDAPLEDFEGVTRRIDGFVYLDGDGLAGGGRLEASEFYFEVDLASLDTGIGLRNRHMRENYLQTSRFPFASFQGRIRVLEPVGNGAWKVVAGGVLTIRGTERPREIECRVDGWGDAPAAGPRPLRVGCAFEVSLSDHGIPIPKLMFMKIDEVMQVELHFHLTPSTRERG